MNEKNEIDPRLKSVYENKLDKTDLYDKWASTYDENLINDLGYVADQKACEILSELVTDKSAYILDAGCGTGLVGGRLRSAGYQNIDGSDFSTGMLEKAKDTNVYNNLFQHDLTKPLALQTPYAALIAVGVFGFNTPSFEHLGHLTDCLVLNGYAVVTVNGKAWDDNNWQKRINEFSLYYPNVQLHKIVTIEYLTTDGIDGQVLVLQKK